MTPVPAVSMQPVLPAASGVEADCQHARNARAGHRCGIHFTTNVVSSMARMIL
jgi:hypothetical protein